MSVSKNQILSKADPAFVRAAFDRFEADPTLRNRFHNSSEFALSQIAAAEQNRADQALRNQQTIEACYSNNSDTSEWRGRGIFASINRPFDLIRLKADQIRRERGLAA
jgi:hypothetical protein